MSRDFLNGLLILTCWRAIWYYNINIADFCGVIVWKQSGTVPIFQNRVFLAEFLGARIHECSDRGRKAFYMEEKCMDDSRKLFERAGEGVPSVEVHVFDAFLILAPNCHFA